MSSLCIHSYMNENVVNIPKKNSNGYIDNSILYIALYINIKYSKLSSLRYPLNYYTTFYKMALYMIYWL